MELSLHTGQKQIPSQKMMPFSEILQMSSDQLKEYIDRQLLENPVMELEEKRPEKFKEKLDEKGMEKYQWIRSHDEQNRFLYQSMEYEEEGGQGFEQGMEEESLQDYLRSQLLTKKIPKALQAAADYLINSLDHRGYFVDSMEEFVSRFSLSTAQGEALLSVIQDLEPAGIGARSLEECLCLQLKRQGELTSELEAFVTGHLEELAKNHLPAIAHDMGLTVEKVKKYACMVKNLDPKPGAQFSDVRRVCYISPDIIVVKFKGHFDIMLNESLYPDISINDYYSQMCKEQEDEEVRNYLLDKIRQTEWLKQCIARRSKTLFSIAQAILLFQDGFFQHGPLGLRPLRFSDVAQRLEIPESTVSRAIKEKYLQCSWGIFPLKYFFVKETLQGGLTKSGVVNAMKELINEENKRKPYSDQQISDLLARRGLPVSRRTVAKYREQEGIPAVSGRRQY